MAEDLGVLVSGARCRRVSVLMDWIEMMGYAAAFCTTAAYVPQVARVWRTRKCEDLSLKMLLLLMGGLALWLGFGLAKGEISIIAANGTTLALAGVILVFKLRSSKSQPQ
jgi:MtN3 and saliva related transmembrane protein